MAERIKTIEWGFETLPGPLSASTGLIVAQWVPELLYLPETASRVFESVYLKINWLNTSSKNTLRANLNSFNIQTRLDGAASYTNNRLTCSVADTGENFSFETWCDATSDFNTHFLSGTEKGLTATFAFTQSNGAIDGLINPVNLTCKAIITYKYNDAGVAKKIKTIRIPLEGTNINVGSSTLGAIVGTQQQIPAFDIDLPESGIVYKNFFIEIKSGINTTTTTGQTCSFNIVGSDVPNSFGVGVMSFSSPNFSLGSTINIFNLFKRNDLTSTFSGTKNLTFLQSAFVASKWAFHQPICYLTYEYDENLSSRVFNSVNIPVNFAIDNNVSSVAQSGTITSIPFMVSEPGQIETKHCGVIGRLNAYTNLASNFNLCEVSQNAATGVFNPATMQTTMKDFVMFSTRIDSGSLRSGSFNLVSGKNNIKIGLYAITGNIVNMLQGNLLLNYISDKDSNGSDVHNKTILKLGTKPAQTNPQFLGIYSGVMSASIPENSWYLNSLGIWWQTMFQATAVNCYNSFIYTKEENIYKVSGSFTSRVYAASIAELCPFGLSYDYTAQFMNHKQDTFTFKFNPLYSRTFVFYNILTNTQSFMYSELIYTYNSISYDIFGRVQNLTGSHTSSSDVYLYSKKTGECLAKTIISQDGFYKFTYFDKNDDLFVGSLNGYVVDSYHVRNSNNRLYVLTTSGSTYGPNSLLGSKWSEAPMYNSMYMFPYRSDDYPSLSNGDQLITWETALSYLGATGTIRG